MRRATPSTHSTGTHRSARTGWLATGEAVEAPSRSQGNSQRQPPLGPKPARTDLMRKECLPRLNGFAWVMRWRSPSRPSVRAVASSVSTSWAPSASDFLRNAVTRACRWGSFITCCPCDRAVYVQARTGIPSLLVYPLTDHGQFDILQSGPGWRGSNAIQSVEAPRVQRAARRRHSRA